MADNDDERSQAGRNWLSTLHQSRVNCREKVADAMVDVPEPDKMFWPIVGQARMTESQRSAMEAHVAVIDFADQVVPYKDESGVDESLWTETLETVTQFEGRDITLESLDEWEFLFYTNEVERTDELHGNKVEQDRYRVLLPVTGMRACYKQLNRITKDLGFAAEADSAGLPKGGLNTPEPK